MTIEVGKAGGGKSLSMPTFKFSEASIKIKTSNNASEPSNGAAFYTEIEAVNLEDFGIEVVTFLPVANSLEQTIIDITGQTGILTNAMSPKLTATTGNMTIRVTADGTLHTFVGFLDSTFFGSFKLVVGDMVLYDAGTTLSDGSGIISAKDSGWRDANTPMFMVNPSQVVSRGLFGIPFKTSLKVTFQGASNVVVGSASHKAMVAWQKMPFSGLSPTVGD